MTNRTRTDALLLAGFCAFLFFYGAGQFGLIGADEPRYAQVAREMLDRHDWITPTLGGHPWLEKPPLYYWQAMLAYSVFGVSDVAARIPAAIDATLLVIAVYLFFRRFRRGVEVDAALITASCAGIVGYARAASMDMALAAAFGVGMLAWWAWRESQKQKLSRAVLCLHGARDVGEGPGRAVSRRSRNRGLCCRNPRMAPDFENPVAPWYLPILRDRTAVVLRRAAAQSAILPRIYSATQSRPLLERPLPPSPSHSGTTFPSQRWRSFHGSFLSSPRSSGP